MCERVWVVDHTRCRYQNFLTPTLVALRSAVLALARVAAANTAHRSDQGATHRRVAAKFIRFGSTSTQRPTACGSVAPTPPTPHGVHDAEHC